MGIERIHGVVTTVTSITPKATPASVKTGKITGDVSIVIGTSPRATPARYARIGRIIGNARMKAFGRRKDTPVANAKTIRIHGTVVTVTGILLLDIPVASARRTNDYC